MTPKHDATPDDATTIVGNVAFGNHRPLVLIAGPCQIESRQHAFDCAGRLQDICAKHEVGFVYKSSFDKANRTSLDGARGLGLEASIDVFAALKEAFSMPIVTDVHLPAQCDVLAPHVDILQIPAFLCRQTDLLIAAAQTGLAVNVKKGQFLAPWDMKFVVEKIRAQGNHRVIVTERGTSFGYNTLVSDLRSLPIMTEETGCPVVFDATHAVQMPGGRGGSSAGERRFAPMLARAAIAVGVAGVFIETHPDPDNAPSDGDVMIPMHDMDALIKRLKELDDWTKNTQRQ